MMLSRKLKSFILMFMDSLFILFSAFLAHFMVEAYIRPDNGFYYVMIGVSILVYLLFGIRHHLFSRIVRYTNVYEILRAAISLTISYTISGFISIIFIRSVSYRYIFLMYVFSLVLIPGARALWNYYHEYKNGKLYLETNNNEEKIRTLLVGAGDGGNLFISNLIKRPSEVQVIGIFDQDPRK